MKRVISQTIADQTRKASASLSMIQIKTPKAWTVDADCTHHTVSDYIVYMMHAVLYSPNKPATKSIINLYLKN